MVVTPLLRQRLVGEEEKENAVGGGASGSGGSPGALTRRALFERNQSAESPWGGRAKATLQVTQGVAAAQVSPTDAERTRANVVKARLAIERWAKITGVDDEAPGHTAHATEPCATAPYGVRCSPDVRVTEFLGFRALEEKEKAPPQSARSGGAAAVAFSTHPQVAAALEESTQQLRVFEERVQKEEHKVCQLREQLAQERDKRADREQQWEALHGRCEQRIRVLEKLRRSEHAEALEEVQRLDANRRDEEELCTVRLVSIWRRAWRVRTLRRCVAVWAQKCQAPGQSWQLVGTVFRAWATRALKDSVRAKARAQEDKLALQNQEYLAAVSNLKSSAQKRLDTALEEQRRELMQKHAKTLSMQQQDFDDQHAASSVLLHRAVTSMHVRYCAGLLRAAFAWLRELSARRRRMVCTASVHHRLHNRWRCLRDCSTIFHRWSRVALSATCGRLARLVSAISVRRDQARRRSLFKAWVGCVHQRRWHAKSIHVAAVRRHCRIVTSCYKSWRTHTAAQRLQNSTLYKCVHRLSNMALWSTFQRWRDFAWESRRASVIMKRVLVRLSHQVLSLAVASWKERCRQKRVLAALLRQMMHHSVASAWRSWQAAVARSRLSHIQDNAAAQQASLREDFLSRLQAAEARMEEEQHRESAELTKTFQDQLAAVQKQQQDRIVRSILTRWRSTESARCLQAWRDWCDSELAGKAHLTRRVFDLWRWCVAASRRHLVRQLRADCEAAKLQMHAMEVQRMKDKETVRQQFEEIEHAFEGMMRTQTNGKKANGSSDALSLAVATEEAREPLASE